MDNQFSQPTIQTPEVPDDFEAKAGSTRKDFAVALFDLLKSAIILGIIPTSPQSYDLVSLIQRVDALESQAPPKMRAIAKVGVINATIDVAFPDIGTTNYSVNVEFLTPDTNINTVTWSVVDGSKATNQVRVRIDGDASTYSIVVHILENLG